MLGIHIGIWQALAFCVNPATLAPIEPLRFLRKKLALCGGGDFGPLGPLVKIALERDYFWVLVLVLVLGAIN